MFTFTKPVIRNQWRIRERKVLHAPTCFKVFHFHAVFGKNIAKQECIPVGCVPPAAVVVMGGSGPDPPQFSP